MKNSIQKKSFLKRVMAAALTVPVALSQTVLFTSFAEGETAATTTLDVNTFVGVNSDVAVNVPVKVADAGRAFKGAEAQQEYAFAQISDWNEKAKTAMNDLGGQSVTLDTKSLVEDLGRNAWYVQVLKDAVAANAGTATAKFGDQEIVVTIDVDYDMADAVVARMQASEDKKGKNITIVKSGEKIVKGSVVITIDTSKLDSKSVSASAAVNINGATDVESGKKLAKGSRLLLSRSPRLLRMQRSLTTRQTALLQSSQMQRTSQTTTSTR